MISTKNMATETTQIIINAPTPKVTMGKEVYLTPIEATQYRVLDITKHKGSRLMLIIP